MAWSRRTALTAAAGLAATTVVGTGRAEARTGTDGESDVEALAYEATVFGTPMALMEATRRTMQVANAGRPWSFIHRREHPGPDSRAVVSPNVDTLYSSTWLDLRRTPVRLRIPDTGGTYYLMQALDGWTDVIANPGSRMSGPGPYTVLIAGATQRIAPRQGEPVVRCATDWTWLIGRTLARTPAEAARAHAIQDGYRLEPLNPLAPAPLRPPQLIPPTQSPAEWVRGLDPMRFLSLLGPLMVSYPPRDADAPQLDRLARLGIAPGRRLGPRPPWWRNLVERGYRRARRDMGTVGAFAQDRNGWGFLPGAGRYGVDYARRAMFATVGLGANLEEDAIYLQAQTGGDGTPLTGGRAYRIRFPAGGLPPAKAFWSITMYDSEQFLVQNPIGRHALGDKDELPVSPDGSIDIVLSHAPPADRRNWLPAPPGEFRVMMRIYDPDPAAVSGHWAPPAVEPIT